MPKKEISVRAVRHLERFFGGQDPTEAATEFVLSVLAINPELTMAQLFNLGANSKGNGKYHCSGKPEGKMKYT